MPFMSGFWIVAQAQNIIHLYVCAFFPSLSSVHQPTNGKQPPQGHGYQRGIWSGNKTILTDFTERTDRLIVTQTLFGYDVLLIND